MNDVELRSQALNGALHLACERRKNSGECDCMMDPEKVLAAAKKFYDFLAGRLTWSS